MGAKDLMRQTHITGKGVEKKENKPTEQKVNDNPVVQEEVAATKEAITPSNPTPVLESGLPTNIRQVKRPDVDISEYGIKPDITNFQLYNYELSEFLTSFSKKNKKNGGNAITKSQLMETILGYAFYDLGLEPSGYKNTQDLLKDLQEKMKK